jgi:heat-inducible transcriptional repressor
MLLDERKRRILNAIIHDYIETAEPVGSRSIARRHELGLSSATIRNEMADLEEMGYLVQPHTSAGRIPSDKGYRMYVDHLMRVKQLTGEETENIRNAMEKRIHELGELIKLASYVMSQFTKYTSMAVTPQMKKITLKAVQAVPVEQGKALVVVVTNAGIVKNCMVRIPGNVTPDFLIRISNILNDKLSGLTIDKIDDSILAELEKETGRHDNLINPILNGVSDCIRQVDNSEVYLEGATNILNFPEFNDVNRAKEFLDVLDRKEIVRKLLSYSCENNGVNVQIGTENEIDKIKDCSIVTATYSVGNVVLGSIGVIGPTRMEYERVVSSMDYIRKKINHQIGKLLFEDN